MTEYSKQKPQETVDISMLGKSHLLEVAAYLKADNLEKANRRERAFAPRDTLYTRYGKRILDAVLALIAVLLTLPVNLVIGIVTFFDVGRPIFFKQTRIGKDRRSFYIYKFRNMTNETDANGELLPPAERVTKWGRFVRRTSLDELLNFVSILKGDMSLIGPRPLIGTYTERLHNRHMMIYSVRPGLECPFHEKLDHPATWQDRLDNYTWYAENVSLIVDVKLILRMVEMVFSRKSTAARSEARHGAVLGYDEAGRVVDSNAVPKKYVDMLLKNHGYASVEEAVMDRYVDPGRQKSA